jgi:hypothetical protein
MKYLLYPVWWILAILHTNQWAVCELSKGKTMFSDFHDYQDDVDEQTSHFAIMTCKHCGKKFMV